MNPTYFPLAIEDMQASVEFRAIQEETFDVEGVEVKTKFLNHPGYALGYRFTYNDKSIVYISDNEPFTHPIKKGSSHRKKSESIISRFEKFVEDQTDDLIQFIDQTDILIHDTQYMPEEYEEKRTWGHSPFDYTVDIARRAKIKKLILFHHDPDHNDDTINIILEESRKLLKKNNGNIACEAAREGRTIELV
jgi:ribonuclease BN (tRNA processing enzyme)